MIVSKRKENKYIKEKNTKSNSYLGAALDISEELARLVIRFGAIEEKCRDASGKFGDLRRRAETTRHASPTMTGLSDCFSCNKKISEGYCSR